MAWSTSKSEILLHIMMIEKRGSLTQRDKQLRKIGFLVVAPLRRITGLPCLCSSIPVQILVECLLPATAGEQLPVTKVLSW